MQHLPEPWSPKKHLIWLILLSSIGLHLFIYILDYAWLADWRWVNIPLHTLIEAFGSAIALFVAYKLLYLNKHQIGPKYAVRIAQALIVMGLLDGFHAASHIGNNFVWLHSLATFLGGFVFAFLSLPQSQSSVIRQTVSLTLLTCGIGFFSLLYPDLAPTMVTEQGFTLTANVLNLLGGVFLLIAAVRLVIEYKKTNSTDDLLFCVHCFLFGLAALMFQSSMLWDASWWGWHYLRLLAYLAALVFVFISEARLLREFSKYGSMMNQLALTDALTGINNRRHFNLQLTNEYARAKRYGSPLSLVLLDLDHFKVLNDVHGHHEGDKVLKHVATLVSQHLRTNDFVARIGGEEFVVLLPSTNQNEAFQFIERIREEIAHLTLTTDSKINMKITASFGIAELSPETASEEALLKQADQALYKAKSNGRNQTLIFTHLQPGF
jgi:diguanylate cyclase (GGDEF)-like protein